MVSPDLLFAVGCHLRVNVPWSTQGEGCVGKIGWIIPQRECPCKEMMETAAVGTTDRELMLRNHSPWKSDRPDVAWAQWHPHPVKRHLSFLMASFLLDPCVCGAGIAASAPIWLQHLRHSQKAAHFLFALANH